MASRCNILGLQELIENSKDEYTESDSFKMIEALAKNNPSSKSFLRSGKLYRGGKKRMKGGASKTAHTLAVCIIAAATYGSWQLGLAAASYMGWLDGATAVANLAQASIAGCGDLTSGSTRLGASIAMARHGAPVPGITCSEAWSTVEAAERALGDQIAIYQREFGGAAALTGANQYTNLVDWIDTKCGTGSGSSSVNIIEKGGRRRRSARRSARRSRKTGSKRGGSCGATIGGRRRRTARRSRKAGSKRGGSCGATIGGRRRRTARR